jgi:hypothetical protein
VLPEHAYCEFRHMDPMAARRARLWGLV